MPSRLALYTFLAFQKQECRLLSASCRGCTACYLDYRQISDRQETITDFYMRLGGTKTDKGICALAKEDLRTYVSKINKDLQKAFGMQAAQLLGVATSGKKPDTSYGLAMDRERIKLLI